MMKSNGMVHRKSPSPFNSTCETNYNHGIAIPSTQTQIQSTKRVRSGIQRQHQLSNKKQCWLASVLYIILVSMLFFILVASKNNDQSKTNNLRQKVNNDCQALNVLSPERISNLEKLNLKGCGLKYIPDTIKYATNLKHLDISDNPELSSLPQELIGCQNLEILFASSCPGIKSLPSVLGLMTSITRLGWRSGSLTSLNPNGIPPNLVHLILTDNKIQKMEDEALFEKLKNVRKLMLSHNEITSFGGNDTGSILHLKNLELLRIAGNKLDLIPEDLWKLPKLTWLTLSGNPFMNKVNIEAKVPWINSQDLVSTGKSLGEGASGKVSSYKWKEQTVAVKIIHGVTSDGRAEDELKVYGAVGSDGLEHRVVGCVALLKGERKGAVMQQLPSNLVDLALPPTIIEVTEDRWDNWKSDTVFSASFVLNVLSDLASALNFLHVNVGVAHGDVYAHNMKVDEKTGHVFLLDFGASFFTAEYRNKAEKIEVRAFGVLIGELLVKLDSSQVSLANELKTLKLQCMDEIVENRVSFNEIENQMMRIRTSYQV